MKVKKLNNQELEILKKVELEIMDEFVRICKKHNLKYVLSFGTCIGAVRHNGFIPWDDDIDIAMPREDYDKFIKIQSEELNDKLYYFQSYETNGLNMSFSKIRRKDSCFLEKTSTLSSEESGIWIDIFPYDYTSNNKFVQKFLIAKIIYLGLIKEAKIGKEIYTRSFIKKIISYIICFLSIFYSVDRINKRIYKIYRKYTNTNSMTSWCYWGSLKNIDIVPADYFDNIESHIFEDRKYNISKYYDVHLSNLYGEYMELPKEEERHSEHYCTEFYYPKEYKK